MFRTTVRLTAPDADEEEDDDDDGLHLDGKYRDGLNRFAKAVRYATVSKELLDAKIFLDGIDKIENDDLEEPEDGLVKKIVNIPLPQHKSFLKWIVKRLRSLPNGPKRDVFLTACTWYIQVQTMYLRIIRTEKWDRIVGGNNVKDIFPITKPMWQYCYYTSQAVAWLYVAMHRFQAEDAWILKEPFQDLRKAFANFEKFLHGEMEEHFFDPTVVYTDMLGYVVGAENTLKLAADDAIKIKKN